MGYIMLKKGAKPKNEPQVSIGLVLPEDKQTKIIIKCSFTEEEYVIKAVGNGLSVNGMVMSEITLIERSNDSSYSISPVLAGRGFHWEKEINIKVEGMLICKNLDGFLFVINRIGLEAYIVSVATSEMSGKCPLSFLEAQIIAARSWLVASIEQKHDEIGIDACNDDCCQRYQGLANITDSARLASQNTRGYFVMYNNSICDTRYSKSCGGYIENNQNVWKDLSKPYLQGKFDGRSKMADTLEIEKDFIKYLDEEKKSYCGNNYINSLELYKYLGSVDKIDKYLKWKLSYTFYELTEIINKKSKSDFDIVNTLIPVKRGVSGRILELKVMGLKNGKKHEITLRSEYEIRNVLHSKFLYSSAFIIKVHNKLNSFDSIITLIGTGWGHGVGLCQIGALGMALSGLESKDIISHYFENTRLVKLYE